MIPGSPAPSRCTTDSTEALLRDLVDIYGEDFVNDPEYYPLSPENNTDYLLPSIVAGNNTGRHISDRNAPSSQVTQHQPMTCSMVPATNEVFLPIPSQEVVHRSNVTSRYPASHSSHVQSPALHEMPTAVVKIPMFSSCPTGGPPAQPEPSLLSGLGSRCEPLQKILQEECAATSVPLSLIQAAAPTTGHIPVKMPLVVRTTQLQVHLQDLCKSNKSKADQLQQFYQIQSARIESDRVVHLCNSTAAPTILPVVNQYFDMQQHALIDNVELQIHCLLYQFLTPGPVQPVRTTKRYATVRNVKRKSSKVPISSSETTNIINILDQCPDTNQQQKKIKPNPLNRVAVRIMNNWYERNQNNPYPSNDTAEVIAKAGNITVEQDEKMVCQQKNAKCQHKTSETST